MLLPQYNNIPFDPTSGHLATLESTTDIEDLVKLLRENTNVAVDFPRGSGVWLGLYAAQNNMYR